MHEKFKIILLSSTIIVIISGLLLFGENNHLSNTNKRQVYEDQLKPRLAAVEYVSTSLADGSIEVRSINYPFRIVIPEGYDISRGWGFNKDFPENQTVSLGASDKDNHQGLTLSVNVGFLNESDIEMIVNDHIKAAKQNLDPAANPDSMGDEVISLTRENLIINGENAIKIRYVGAFDQETIGYYFYQDDKYYRIYFGRNDGGQFTANQLQEVEKTINSFKLVL